jgi:putative peptidoglycan lipid II flippase
MLPVLFGQGILLIGTFLDAQICVLFTHKGGPLTASLLGLSFSYPLEEGALSTITCAQRLYQFPLGVLGISLAVAALPTFSRLATHRDWAGWTGEVVRALRLAAFIGLSTGGLMIVLAEPIVQLLFEYRNFDAADTARAARVLRLYGLGMWAFCVQHIVLRGFYSVGDVRTPVRISCVFVPLNLAISLVLIWFEGVREAAFAISTSITSTLTVLVGLVLLQRKTETRLADRGTLWAAAKMLAAAAISTLAVAWLRQLWTPGLSEAVDLVLLRRAIDTFGALALGCGLFLGLGMLMGLPETKLVLRYRRRS